MLAPCPDNRVNCGADAVRVYGRRDVTSRPGGGVGVGSISLPPGGFTPGPQPVSFESALCKAATDETAVMIDTFAPLDLAPAIGEVDDPAYPWTWAR